jgi:hypothetical protein
MKATQTGEFIWRPSSSLAHAATEIFAHVLLDYYCMPQPFRFEHPDVPVPKKDDPSDPLTQKLANALVTIAQQQGEWWRTKNVVIPWGATTCIKPVTCTEVGLTAMATVQEIQAQMWRFQPLGGGDSHDDAGEMNGSRTDDGPSCTLHVAPFGIRTFVVLTPYW